MAVQAMPAPDAPLVRSLAEGAAAALRSAGEAGASGACAWAGCAGTCMRRSCM